MYLNLLASAMDDRVAKSVHPGFVEIIKQLNANEAKLLRTVLAMDIQFPIAEIYLYGRYGYPSRHFDYPLSAFAQYKR